MSAPYRAKHRFDLVPSPVDHRDFKIGAPIDFSQVPPAATLPLTPPVRDQGQEGSCWGFSGSAAHQAGRMIKGTGSDVLSPAFLYWQTRKAMGDTADDTGSDIRTGLDALLHIGNCTEDHMPYVAGDFAQEPLPAAVIDASTRTITAYHRLTMLNEIRYAISLLKLPVVFGIPVTQAFEESRDGMVPMIAPGDNILGGHAIMCVGYQDDASVAGGGWFDLQNSWGPQAGRSGHYFLPYGYMFNTFVNWSEAWSIDA